MTNGQGERDRGLYYRTAPSAAAQHPGAAGLAIDLDLADVAAAVGCEIGVGMRDTDIGLVEASRWLSRILYIVSWPWSCEIEPGITVTVPPLRLRMMRLGI